MSTTISTDERHWRKMPPYTYPVDVYGWIIHTVEFAILVLGVLLILLGFYISLFVVSLTVPSAIVAALAVIVAPRTLGINVIIIAGILSVYHVIYRLTLAVARFP